MHQTSGTSTECARRQQQFPEPVVSALVFNPEGKMLLVKSHKWRGRYIAPGGHIELGETIEDALRREVKEETGLDVYDIEFVCFQQVIFDNTAVDKRHVLVFAYTCKAHSLSVRLDAEAEEYVWVSLEEALALPLVPDTERAIEEYLNGRK